MKNSSQSKLSMVMPVYNKKDDIAFMLESIINQTWDNIELIMVNDGATDGTREIIEDWLPRFHKRGYTAIVIDQENQGISAAVRNGMLRMTGDLFCSVDCDDYLYPEYASTMASWLDEHPEYDYAACGYERVFGKRNNPANWSVRPGDPEWPENLQSSKLIENILMYRLAQATWIFIIRKTYLKKCKIVENFVTVPLYQQEPSLLIPLVLGSGKLKYFPQILYRHLILDRTHPDKRFGNVSKTAMRVHRTVIERFLSENDDFKKRLLNICEFAEVKGAFIYYQYLPEADCKRAYWADRAAYLTNTYFTPSPNVTADDILLTGFRPFFHALESCLLEQHKPSLKNTFETLSKKRIVCCASLGLIAKQIIPILSETKLKPDVLWDVAAKQGASLCGISVEKPDFDMLNEDDIFLIPTPNSALSRDVVPLLKKRKVKNVINYFDILQYLAECYYPYFTNHECKYIFNS